MPMPESTYVLELTTSLLKRYCTCFLKTNLTYKIYFHCLLGFTQNTNQRNSCARCISSGRKWYIKLDVFRILNPYMLSVCQGINSELWETAWSVTEILWNRVTEKLHLRHPAVLNLYFVMVTFTKCLSTLFTHIHINVNTAIT